jgi:hypothetical protein
MPQTTVTTELIFNGSHCVFLYVALLSALLGYIIASLKGGRRAAIAGAGSGGISGFVFYSLLSHVAASLNRPDSPGAILTFFILTSTAGLLGGMAGKAFIDYFFKKITYFPHHPAGFPPTFYRPDTIEKPDVRKATERLQRERYTVIDLDNKPQDSNGYLKEQKK